MTAESEKIDRCMVVFNRQPASTIVTLQFNLKYVFRIVLSLEVCIIIYINFSKSFVFVVDTYIHRLECVMNHIC